MIWPAVDVTQFPVSFLFLSVSYLAFYSYFCVLRSMFLFTVFILTVCTVLPCSIKHFVTVLSPFFIIFPLISVMSLFQQWYCCYLCTCAYLCMDRHFLSRCYCCIYDEDLSDSQIGPQGSLKLYSSPHRLLQQWLIGCFRCVSMCVHTAPECVYVCGWGGAADLPPSLSALKQSSFEMTSEQKPVCALPQRHTTILQTTFPGRLLPGQMPCPQYTPQPPHTAAYHPNGC